MDTPGADLSNERLLAYAARNPPPQSWYDEDEDLFLPPETELPAMPTPDEAASDLYRAYLAWTAAQEDPAAKREVCWRAWKAGAEAAVAEVSRQPPAPRHESPSR